MSASTIKPKSEPKLPIVAIIGRPNVGKSTLFNRLIKKRRAITDPTPGVTRDLIYERYVIDDREVLLVDSGGIKGDLEGLDQVVREKSLTLLEEADVIIFMLDCTDTTAEDEMLVEMVRPYESKIVVAVNKVDNVEREALIWNYHAYGLRRVVSISSAHGLGIDLLEEEIYDLLPPQEEQEVREVSVQGITLAVLGKPNTGKSTLVNLLTKQELSIVSDIPGTTRDVVSGTFSYQNQNFTILDTAGMRRKSKVSEDVEYYSVNRAVKAIDESDIILLMMDSETGLVEQDKKIAQLAVRKGKGIILVLNKIDIFQRQKNQLQAIKDRTKFLFPILDFAPLVAISAQTSENLEQLLKTIMVVHEQLNKRVETPRLNDLLGQWQESYHIPRSTRGHYRILYGTQTSAAPVKFVLFVNRLNGFPSGYLQYLKNAIRRDLGFSMIPLDIVLKERTQRSPKRSR